MARMIRPFIGASGEDSYNLKSEADNGKNRNKEGPFHNCSPTVRSRGGKSVQIELWLRTRSPEYHNWCIGITTSTLPLLFRMRS